MIVYSTTQGDIIYCATDQAVIREFQPAPKMVLKNPRDPGDYVFLPGLNDIALYVHASTLYFMNPTSYQCGCVWNIPYNEVSIPSYSDEIVHAINHDVAEQWAQQCGNRAQGYQLEIPNPNYLDCDGQEIYFFTGLARLCHSGDCRKTMQYLNNKGFDISKFRIRTVSDEGLKNTDPNGYLLSVKDEDTDEWVASTLADFMKSNFKPTSTTYTYQ